MPSIIQAGNAASSGLVTAGATDGILELRSGTAVGGTVAMTINSLGAVSVNAGLAVTGAINALVGVSTLTGNTGSLPANTAVTAFSLSLRGLHTVYARLPGGQGDIGNYSSSATILFDGSSARITANNGTLLAITLSGLAVQVNQSSGAVQPLGVSWSYLLQPIF